MILNLTKYVNHNIKTINLLCAVDPLFGTGVGHKQWKMFIINAILSYDNGNIKGVLQNV